MANKKIFVLKLRELIYTGIFLFFGIVLILLMVAMFSGKKTGNGKKPGSGSSGAQTAQDGAVPEAGGTPAGVTGNGNAGEAETDHRLGDSDLTQTFLAGVYTTDLTLSGNTFTLQLIVDSDRVKSVDLLSLDHAAADSASSDTTASSAAGDEYIATMYPLMEPALSVIESSLTEGIPLSDITFGIENQYTGGLLVQAVEKLLEKAAK